MKDLQTPAFAPANFEQLLASLTTVHALVQLAVVLGCLLLAWLVGWTVRRSTPQASHQASSVLLGRHVIDGALFPILALLFAVLARRLAFAGAADVTVLRLAIPLLFALAVIRVAVRVLRAALPSSSFVKLVERTLSWLVWGGMVLWVTGLLPLIQDELGDVSWKVGAARITLRSLVEGAINATVVLVLALWLSSAIEAKLLRSATGASLSGRKIAVNAVRALLLLVGLLVALSAAGIDLTALSVLGGAVGVGIGFGLQKLASNYVSGFVILAERSVRIGDLVKVDGFEGRVIDINTRYTVIRASNGRESIVPNEMLITQRVENASSLYEPSVMLSTVVQVAYGTDVVALRPKLLAAFEQIARVMKDPDLAPAVHLTSFASDGLELTVWFWIADPLNGQSNVRSEVNLAILEVLGREGIEIPFPQRVMRYVGTPPAAAGAEAAAD
ncbi:mechanosensitive ion channel family protein [Caldimonas sp. KR1-144]|uniref:mechanosensitive ion channel family protein n=1 Tax=Caldimonas sp. KR1-144 TaxID=3400911 RepID=UPI003C014A16